MSYELVDEKTEEVLLLLGFVTEEGEDECEGLGADIRQWVQGQRLCYQNMSMSPYVRACA
jgi:hypothetical protein